MATKQLYATRDFKYGTRMLRAGDPVEMTGPHERLYRALNAVSHERPRKAAVKAEAPAAVEEAPAKAKPRKRKAAKKK